MKYVLEHFGGALSEGMHIEAIGADTCKQARYLTRAFA